MSDIYRGKIDEYIDSHREDMLRDLETLMRIDSTKGEKLPGKPFGEGPAKVLAAMEELLGRSGLRVTNYDNYAVTGDLDGKGTKALDILAHLDVVPVSEDWTVTAPFEPKIIGDRIYGRGSSDDKGPAIAALYAVKAVKELGIPLERGVRLIFGSDEECGSEDLEYYYAKEEEAEYTFTPDAAFPLINLEKARYAKYFTANVIDEKVSGAKIISVKCGDKGNVIPGKAVAVVSGLSADVLRSAADAAAEKTGASFSIQAGQDETCTILVKGQTGHASTPDHAINAATALLELLTALPFADSESFRAIRSIHDLFPFGDNRGEALGVAMGDEESGDLTMSLDIVNLDGGRLYAEFDSRAPLCATDENLTAVVQKKLKNAGFTVEEGNLIPVHYVSADSHFVKTLLASYEKYSGKEGKPFAIGGGTYVHNLERGVAFGCEDPAVDNHMHGDDEFMLISVILESAKIFADAIVNLCV